MFVDFRPEVNGDVENKVLTALTAYGISLVGICVGSAVGFLSGCL